MIWSLICWFEFLDFKDFYVRKLHRAYGYCESWLSLNLLTQYFSQCSVPNDCVNSERQIFYSIWFEVRKRITICWIVAEHKTAYLQYSDGQLITSLSTLILSNIWSSKTMVRAKISTQNKWKSSAGVLFNVHVWSVVDSLTKRQGVVESWRGVYGAGGWSLIARSSRADVLGFDARRLLCSRKSLILRVVRVRVVKDGIIHHPVAQSIEIWQAHIVVVNPETRPFEVSSEDSSCDPFAGFGMPAFFHDSADILWTGGWQLQRGVLGLVHFFQELRIGQTNVRTQTAR